MTRATSWGRALLCWSAPLVAVLALSALEGAVPATWHADAGTPALVPAQDTSQGPEGKTVLVIVDSLTQQALDAHMPALRRWAQGHVRLPVKTCSANYTVPCVQTLMEGRQSPFVAGLHNFTGKSGGDQSIPAQLNRAGRTHVLVSDFTLDTLYGPLAHTSLNVEGWPGGILEHDLDALKRARALMATPDLNFMALHLVGTDKAAHRYTPSSPRYAEHFQRVDEALGVFLRSLEPTTHVLVTGDHGHDAKGHHDRDSVLLARSPVLRGLPLPDVIQQHEVTYLMWLTLGLSAPSDYEGRYIGLEQAQGEQRAAGALLAFARRQARALAAQGHEGASLAAQIASRRVWLAAAPWRSVWRHALLLLVYVAWVFGLMGASAKLVYSWRSTLGFAGACLGAWGLGLVLPAWAMGGLGALGWCVTLGWLWRRAEPSQRGLLALGVLCLMAAVATALSAESWSGFWHTKGGFQYQTPLFFVGLLACGALGSKLRSRRWLAYWPEALGALCLWALPSGVYFYQFGPNISRGLFLGAAPLLLAVAATKTLRAELKWPPFDRHLAASLGLFVVSSGLLLWQHAGGWEWHFGLAYKLKRGSAWWPTLIHAGFGLWSAWVLCPSARKRALGWLVLWALPMLLSVWVGLLPAQDAMGAGVAIACLASLWALGSRGARLRAPDALDSERAGWWMFGLSAVAAWILYSGFFIGQVDFNFTFPYLKGIKREAYVAFWSTIMTSIKYTLPIWGVVVAARWSRSRQAWLGVMKWFWVVLHVKCVALLLQSFAGPLWSEQKLYELAISELMFIMALGWKVCFGMALVGAWDRFVEKQLRAQTP